jgi:hypothetical protein
MTKDTTAISKDLLSVLMQQNMLLLQQQKDLQIEREAYRIEMMKMEFSMRASLPADTRPQWVSKDEAAWLLGLTLFTTGHHRRAIGWLHDTGELITTAGGRNSMLFLRSEVMDVNQRIVEGTVIVPKKFG